MHLRNGGVWALKLLAVISRDISKEGLRGERHALEGRDGAQLLERAAV